MEFKTNNNRSQPNSGGTSHFTESNAGHISVKTTSPFLNKKKDSEFCVAEQNLQRSRKNQSFVGVNKKLPRDIASGTSKMLINQILGDSNVDKEAVLNLSNEPIEKCKYNTNFLISNVELRYSTPTFNSKSFSMQPGSCSREESLGASSSSVTERKVRAQMNVEKHCAEKMTYCRPVKTNNLEYINKTVEKNNRLQRLVQKLIDTRKKQKQTEAWNNYINELKNKHGYGDNGRNGFDGQYNLKEPTNLEYIDDYYSPQTKPKLSIPCKNLLNEFYEAYNTVEYDNPYRNPDTRNQRLYPNCKSYLNNTKCYPMSSQGRLKITSCEKNKNPYDTEWRQLPSSRPFSGNTIFVDKEPGRRRTKPSQVEANDNQIKCTCPQPAPTSRSASMQTDREAFGVTFCVPSTSKDEENVKQTKDQSTQVENINDDLYSRVSENVDRLKRRLQETCNIDTSNLQHTVLQSIESKIDTLLTSMNSFIEEVKSKAYPSNSQNRSYDCRSVSIQPFNFSKKNLTGMSRSDTDGLINAERYVCGLPERPKTSSYRTNKIFDGTRGIDIDQLLIGKTNSNDRVKEDIDSILNGKVGNCSVQISIEIPTKERSTEVTDSLSRAVFQLEDKTVPIQEIRNNRLDRDRNMTIAVNTDPLGILALLRVSTETVKQILSYMPNIPYHNYLSMIPFPPRQEVSHYVCNICGAAFVKPSQLSDHIRSHDLGRARDCCVCRHVLDMQRHRIPGLFRCRHCGQRFTRAYCCELHQESCARRLGYSHDVTPSRMMLR